MYYWMFWTVSGLEIIKGGSENEKDEKLSSFLYWPAAGGKSKN